MIADTSKHVVSFAGYVYGYDVAELTEEITTKLSLTKSAGIRGGRIGENFQDIKRLIVSGTLSEDSEENAALADPLPLRAIVQRFRYGHRPELGKQRLVLHDAADGRPAEFVLAAVENITGLKWEAPIIQTDFEVSFVSEPEIWYDSPQTVNLRAGRTAVGHTVGYTKNVQYVGPDTNFYADIEALPIITLIVTDVDADQVGTGDPPYIEIGNTVDDQTFRLYPIANDTFILDSYLEGIRNGSITWDGGTIYEFVDYDQFIYLGGGAVGAGVTNTLTITCVWCDVSTASMVYYPRHL